MRSTNHQAKGLAFVPGPSCGGAPLFIRSDCNGDGSVDVADPVFVLNSLFVAGSPAPDCEDACDANDDGGIDISDPVYGLNNLFVMGSPVPPPPFPGCGTDPSPDPLDCGSTAGCP